MEEGRDVQRRPCGLVERVEAGVISQTLGT